MLEASMLVIGDEILSGHVVDTNSPWLADRLREHGVPLRAVQVVGDDAEDIDAALQQELGRERPRVVLTSGGIGSTPDDLTYEAIAASLGVGLVEDALIAERVDAAIAWSAEQGFGVTDGFVDAFHRMARIPAGGRVLTRDGGWAAAVVVDVDGGSQAGGASVVVLPGVPSEFRSLVSQVIEPELLAGRNPVPVVEEIEHEFPESVLNPIFAEMLAGHPEVKLGSYPGRPMMIRLTGEASQVGPAAAFVRDALSTLGESAAGRRLTTGWRARRTDDGQERS